MTTSGAVLSEESFHGVPGFGETRGLRIPRTMPSVGPVDLQGLKSKQGQQGVLTFGPDVTVYGSSGTTVIQAKVSNPIEQAVARIQQAVNDIVGAETEVSVSSKRWEDGTPYVSLVAQVPVDSVEAALIIEDGLLDWVVDNVSSLLRGSLVVSVEPGH